MTGVWEWYKWRRTTQNTLEPPPTPAPAKDLPQLSTLPRSARAAETHFARGFAWGHA